MYRAVALYFERHQISTKNPDQVEQALHNIQIEFKYNADLKKSETFLNGTNEEEAIRGLGVADMASRVSALPVVRRFLVAQLQEKGKMGGLIMDGRDIGTVVFPHAELKLFITAQAQIRAQRRLKELQSKNISCTLEEVQQNLQERDYNDTTRADSPLRKAHDAILIDNSHLSPDEQLDLAFKLAQEKIAQG